MKETSIRVPKDEELNKSEQKHKKREKEWKRKWKLNKQTENKSLINCRE